jgi:uncharacterized SAM-binding protein YcdF (DUF218 family)
VLPVSWISYSFLIPPNLFILLAVIGVLQAWRRRPVGLALATAAMFCLYLVSMPVTAALLIRWSEALAATAPRSAGDARPGAIIVLAADVRYGGPSGEPVTVGPLTLERLAEAARRERQLGLPILVSGGPPGPPERTLAALMSNALQHDFGVPVRWREDRSRNTFENAAFSAAILREAGIGSALVVAHPWDMARALWSFHAVGYPVAPLATPGGRKLALSPPAFLPQVPALQDSYYALHELIGLGWYRLRYGEW